MLFNSLHFLVFFPVVVIIYFLLPHRFRWILLLLSSYYFYMSWEPEYVLLIMVSTLIDYFAGLKIGETDDRVKRKKFLYASLIVNLGLLFTFKYFNFFSDNLRAFFDLISLPVDTPTLKLLLPVGISFYTFQTMSYSIDVYRGKIKPEKHLGIFAVYVSFFPQLVAGPIERAGNLLPQFFEKKDYNFERISGGLKLMIWGFFKKLVIADRVAVVVDQVFNNVTDYSGIPILLAVFFFSIQVYCDFSAYSDIAIGGAKIMGYDLMTNFRRPYFSRSIAEFWRRWHISLSTWFQDYVFTPLYLETAKMKLFHKLNPRNKHLVVFAVSIISGEALLGLWHGAAWTYVVFGLFHGMLIALYYIFRRYWDNQYEALKILFTYLLVTFSYIFFRANNLHDAYYLITHLFSGISLDFQGIYLGGLGGWLGLKIALAPVVFFVIVEILEEFYNVSKIYEKSPRLVRWSGYMIVLFWILMFGMFEEKDFIYFQF